ncbi:hypothetical protein POTOM_012451 [Populus tomentosa]|uniref:tryptophan--tRNA ligase n=2 Tax=Magnoliopsida TaxID=3398 RepID=A0A8X8D0Q8_POPTO|nr:hypothetical protein POTOM_012451 [Populus tomentosa]
MWLFAILEKVGEEVELSRLLAKAEEEIENGTRYSVTLSHPFKPRSSTILFFNVLPLSTLYISCSYFVAYLYSMSPLYSHIHSLSDFSSKLNGFASKSVRIRQNSKYSNGFRCYCDVSHSQQTSPENSPTSVTVKKRIVSGVQPTGSVHLGNYLGAIKNWIALQNTYETLFFIVDLHAESNASCSLALHENNEHVLLLERDFLLNFQITLPYDTKELSKATRDTAAIYLACGIDASKASVFVQSHVHAHVELMWLLSSATPIGWLNRMIQFKEKSRKAGDENVGVALLTYPVLMASDILLYQSDFVPVGEDQKQHLELTRELAERVNYLYGGRKWKKLGGRGGAIFKVPEPLIPPAGARVMSLTDGLSKMSKSAPSDQSRINLLDPKDVIANKIKRCKTDSFPALEFDNPERPECNNLLSVYQLVSGKTKEDVAKECQGLNWGSFKPLLTDALIEHLHPIQVRYEEIHSDSAYLDSVLEEGARKASEIADATLKNVYQAMGFLRR